MALFFGMAGRDTSSKPASIREMPEVSHVRIILGQDYSEYMTRSVAEAAKRRWPENTTVGVARAVTRIPPSGTPGRDTSTELSDQMP